MTDLHRYAKRRMAACAAACSMLVACAAPSSPEPARWPLAAQSAEAMAPFKAWPDPQWWKAWSLPELDALIERARAHAPTLVAAQARVRASQAALDRTQAGQGLQAGLTLETTRLRYSEVGAVPAALAGRQVWNNAARLNLNWDLDWSGRQRAALEASFAALQSVRADAQAAQILLDTEVALAWFELARVRSLRVLTERIASIQARQVDIASQRIAAGLDRPDGLYTFQAALARSNADRADWVRLELRTVASLAELCGIAAADVPAGRAHWPKQAAPAVLDDLPASLLARRADLTAHRWRIEAAEGAVRQAHAAHLPDVNLAAFAGLLSLGLDRWVSLGARSYGVGPIISLPLFDAGARAAQQSEREAHRDALIADYHAALLRAVREVAQELEGLQALQGQREALQEAARTTNQLWQVSERRRQAGVVNVLPVLEAEISELQQQRLIIETEARQWQGRIGLVRALGGGFDDERSVVSLRSSVLEKR